MVLEGYFINSYFSIPQNNTNFVAISLWGTYLYLFLQYWELNLGSAELYSDPLKSFYLSQVLTKLPRLTLNLWSSFFGLPKKLVRFLKADLLFYYFEKFQLHSKNWEDDEIFHLSLLPTQVSFLLVLTVVQLLQWVNLLLKAHSLP